MQRNTADLGCYIEYIRRDSPPFHNRVFDQGISHLRPMLKNDRTNRILLYPGSFNPPHIGHYALLQHVFESGKDIGILAAIILPLDDDSVVAKCRAIGQSLVFGKAQRIRLWQGNGPQDWYWVYDGSMKDWSQFRGRLTRAIVNDGFDIKFVVLTGPDYISRQASLPWDAWNCEEIIVSNVSRLADFATSSDTLWRLPDCEPWKKISWNGHEATQHATRIAGYLSGAIPPKILVALLEEGQQYLNFLEAQLH